MISISCNGPVTARNVGCCLSSTIGVIAGMGPGFRRSGATFDSHRLPGGAEVTWVGQPTNGRRQTDGGNSGRRHEGMSSMPCKVDRVICRSCGARSYGETCGMALRFAVRTSYWLVHVPLNLCHRKYSGVPAKTVASPITPSSGRSYSTFQMITIDIRMKNTGTKG